MTPVPEAPVRPWLATATPNPSNRVTEIRYTLPAEGRMQLSIHDVTGREVVRIVDGGKVAGPHTARWDGLDSRGRQGQGRRLYRPTRICGPDGDAQDRTEAVGDPCRPPAGSSAARRAPTVSGLAPSCARSPSPSPARPPAARCRRAGESVMSAAADPSVAPRQRAEQDRRDHADRHGCRGAHVRAAFRPDMPGRDGFRPPASIGEDRLGRARPALSAHG